MTSLIWRSLPIAALEAYLAGLVASDGHIENDVRTTISSADLEFSTTINHIAKLKHLHPSFFWDHGAGVYKIAINSKQFVATLNNKYSIPQGKKSSKIGVPSNLTRFEELWYLRGWLDGEGWVELAIHHVKQKTYKYPRIGFKTKSKQIREWVAIWLRRKGLRVATYDRKDGSYGLAINGTRETQAFSTRLGFIHPRQSERLLQVVSEVTSIARDAG